jgi:hypothetical protein
MFVPHSVGGQSVDPMTACCGVFPSSSSACTIPTPRSRQSAPALSAVIAETRSTRTSSGEYPTLCHRSPATRRRGRLRPGGLRREHWLRRQDRPPASTAVPSAACASTRRRTSARPSAIATSNDDIVRHRRRALPSGAADRAVPRPLHLARTGTGLDLIDHAVPRMILQIIFLVACIGAALEPLMTPTTTPTARPVPPVRVRPIRDSPRLPHRISTSARAARSSMVWCARGCANC